TTSSAGSLPREAFMAPPYSDAAAGVETKPGVRPDTGFGRVEALERYGTLAARILISQIFLSSGVMKVLDPAGTAAQMGGRHMFWIPFFLWSAAAVELVGGLSVLVGFKTRLGALLLFLFLIPVTLTFHTLWTYPLEQQKS